MNRLVLQGSLTIGSDCKLDICY